jgi:hypothetical protein
LQCATGVTQIFTIVESLLSLRKFLLQGQKTGFHGSTIQRFNEFRSGSAVYFVVAKKNLSFP